jgi:hypothetical protein
MSAAEGTGIAIANDQFETLMADAGSSAIVVYANSELEDPANDRACVLHSGMGFSHIDECGWVEIPEDEAVLTVTLEWDRHV